MIDAVFAGLHGVRRQIRTVFWVYVLGTLLTLPLALTAYALIDRAFGASLDSGRFAARLEPALVMELLRREPVTLPSLVAVGIPVLVFWSLWSVFSGGAVLVGARDGRSLTFRAFVTAGADVFARLFRLLPLGLIYTAIVGGLPLWLMFWLGNRWTESAPSPDASTFLIRFFTFSFGLLCLGFANAGYDAMKICVVGEQAPVLKAFLRGAQRSFARPVSLLVAYLPFVLVGAALVASSSLIDVRLTRSGWTAIALGVALQQATLVLRSALRIGLANAETHWSTTRRS